MLNIVIIGVTGKGKFLCQWIKIRFKTEIVGNVTSGCSPLGCIHQNWSIFRKILFFHIITLLGPISRVRWEMAHKWVWNNFWGLEGRPWGRGDSKNKPVLPELEPNDDLNFLHLAPPKIPPQHEVWLPASNAEVSTKNPRAVGPALYYFLPC